MKKHLVNVGLAAVAAVAAVATYPAMVRRLSVDGIHIPSVLKSVTSFSDRPAFKETSPRVFQYKNGKKEPRLRLSFPSGHYEDVQLLLKIRAPERALAGMFPRGTLGAPQLTKPVEVSNGVATLNFAHVSGPATEYSTGMTYIGVSFSPGTIQVNDKVEIVDLKFHYGTNTRDTR